MTDQPPPDDPYSGLMPIYRDLIVRLDAEQQTLLAAFQEERKSTRDGMIYHYTGDVGLYHILSSGNLWVSDFTSMNDPSEINHGIVIGIDVLREELRRRGNHHLGLLFVNSFETIAKKGLHTFMSAYVLSTSLDDDELTQWRLYADGGAGFAMGYDSTILDRAHDQYMSSGGLGGSFRVLYDEAHLRSQMLLYVTKALNVIQTMPRGPNHAMLSFLAKIGTNLMFAMIYTALYFKHPAYRYEREYRYLIVTRPNEVVPGLMKRPRRNKLIDYLNLDWKTQFSASLKTIRVGPAAEYARAQSFVRESLGLYLPGPLIGLDQSKVPFRLN